MRCKPLRWSNKRAGARVVSASSKLMAIFVLVGSTGVALAATSVIPGDDQVVARRGGESVTLLEIDARMMELPSNLRADFLNDPSRIEDTVSAILLEKQMAAKAGGMGLDTKTDPYLEAQIAQAVTRYMGVRAKQLEEDRMEVPDFTELAQEKYQANPAKYATPETLELTHVLIADRGRSDADAKALAEDVRRQALAGTDFNELVAKYTDEQSAGKKSTGRLSDVTTGVMVPEFEKTAFALKSPGDISEVVKTRFGYHVIRLEGRKPTVQQPYEAVQAQIVEELRKQYVSQNKGTMVDELRSMKIEANPELVASLRTRYAKDGPVMSKVSAASAGHASATSR